jgi:lysine 2,3-aminomutase
MTTLRSASALAEAGLIAPERLSALEAVAARYAVAVTPAMADLIDAADPADPIARQLIPDPAELDLDPTELVDPIGDEAHSPLPGVVHRYPDRLLLKVIHTCAVYCRFCFRREVVGPAGDANLTGPELDAALAYVADHPEIWEVILTGGDPLVLSPRRLRDLIRRLSAIDHVKVIRLHTRLPVADPEAVTPAMVEALRSGSKAVWVAVHVNHAREISPAARAACARLVDAGIPLVSQSVLLAGVNDDAEALEALLRALLESRIKPYYLHHLDNAPGTARFRTRVGEGQALMRRLRGRLSGLAQPTYVLDIPGGHGKVPIGPGYLRDGTVEDPGGDLHPYPAD